MLLTVLLYFIVVVHCINVTNVLDSIGSIAEWAADKVTLVTECEFRCPHG